MHEHNINGFPCKDLNTKSDPNTDSLFWYQIQLLAIFTLPDMANGHVCKCSRSQNQLKHKAPKMQTKTQEIEITNTAI